MVSSGALPDPSFLFAQALSGLTAAMFLFLIAAGLSLIFGVLRVLNFSHGSFYMLGAYLAYQVVQWAATTPGRFWWATIGAALGIAALGGVVERLLLRHLYAKEELYQLLFTYALVLILGDVAKKLWGTGQLSVSRPPGLTGAVELFGTRLPYYNLFILLLGPAIALAFWIVLHRTRTGRFIRAAALDREMLGALGVNVTGLYTGVFVIGSFLAGLGGAPWGPLVMVAAFFVPALGSRFYTFVATDVVIMGLFAVSLNLLIGYTGLVSFGHAAYFGIGAYTTGILMKKLGVPFVLAFPAAGLGAGLAALVFGFFCVRLTKIYFAMLTLAFAQIVWAICFKWNDVTGGEQGMPEIPYPALDWMQRLPFFGDFRASDHFYLVTVVLVALCFWTLRRIVGSPFGRLLTTIRENPERAEFIGVSVRRYELIAFVIAGIFAGLAGGLFGIFNRGAFPDFAYWTKSSEVLIMTLLGGMGSFWGPAVGALVLLVLNQQITSYTEYWPFVLGTVLIVILFAFPGGIVGALDSALARLRARHA